MSMSCLISTEACCPDSRGMSNLGRPEASLRWHDWHSPYASLPRLTSPGKANVVLRSPSVGSTTFTCAMAGSAVPASTSASARARASESVARRPDVALETLRTTSRLMLTRESPIQALCY